MLARLRYLKLALTLTALLTLYVTLLTTPVEQAPPENFIPKTGIREVVAYSLNKQIEIESEEVSCDAFTTPEVSDVETEGVWTRVPDTDLFVFGVYYDDRLEPFRYLRLLGMIKGTWNRTLYCQTSSGDDIHVTKAARTEIWYKEWDVGAEDTFNPVLLSCYLPKGTRPKKLSLNLSPCKLSKISFKITPSIMQDKTLNNRHKKYYMTVCVKPLDFTKDISKRLMQWIEINKILGADRFEFFVRKIPGKVLQTLEFYRRKYGQNFLIKYYRNVEDFVRQEMKSGEQKGISRRGNSLITRQTHERNNEIDEQEENRPLNKTSFDAGKHGSVKKKHNHNETPSEDVGIGRALSTTVNNTGASERKIWQKRRNELMAYNDCLYRNLRSSHFVIPVDIDEIIVPKRFYTWEDSLGHLFTSAPRLQEDYASFSATNTYFLEEFSRKRANKPAFFFEYVERSEFSEEGESGKSFISTKNALTVFNHYALDALKPGIRRTYFLPRELVQMNHYKRTCSVNLLPQCAKYLSSPVRTVDTLIYKYKREFVENYEKVVGEFNEFNRKRTFRKTVFGL